MQEELKSARNKYTLMREEVDVQRRNVDTKEQETFAAQSMLIDVQEELERMRQQVKVVEGQKDALKTALKGEEVARLAAEGPIGLPMSPDDDELTSPKKRSPLQHRESLKENVDPEAPQIEDELLALKEELRMEKRMRSRADDQVHFMKMECQFQCCSCRVAERQGTEYVHDDSLAERMGDIAANIVNEHELASSDQAEQVQEQPITPSQQPSEQREISDPLIEYSPKSGTFHKAPSSPTPSSPIGPLELSQPASPTTSSTPPQSTIQSPPIRPSTPSAHFTTPRPLPVPPVRTISHTTTTTVTVPLKDDTLFSPAPMTPGGISREEALEQIRQRRGRARSIAAGNGTPRRRMVEVGELRRDISAPGRV